jgi:general secretion pathway protein G
MFQRPRQATQRITRGAFTLIEVLLVLIILVVIFSIVTPKLFGTKEKADIDATKVQIGAMQSAFDLYRLHTNRYPVQLEDLWKEPSDAALAEKWGGPYLDQLKPDPWGNPYQYSAEGKHNPDKYDLWSYGPDGQNGSDDDIGNWDKSS